MPLLPADFSHARACKPFCEKSLTLPVFFLIHYELLSATIKDTDKKKKRREARRKERRFSLRSWGGIYPCHGRMES